MKKLFQCMMIISILFIVPAKANTNVGETTVLLNFTEESRFKLIVNVSEGGALYDGEQKIENGTVEYDVSLDTEKKFRIVPDKGYHLDHIWYERPELPDIREMADMIENNSVRIKVESTEMILNVDFKKNLEDISEIDGINTGDHEMATRYGLLICISGGILLILYRRKKKASYDTRNV